MDTDTISKAPVDILLRYFSTLGDCIAIKDFCRKKVETSQRKMGMVDLIRKKMRKKRKGKSCSSSDEENLSFTSSTPRKRKNARDTKQIMIGWLCSTNGDRHKQVREKQGGGTRKLIVNKNATKDEILTASKNIFFKNGISPKGREEQFSFSIWDFQQNPVGDYTVEEMFEITGLTRLRFYLVSTEKTSTISESRQSTLPPDELEQTWEYINIGNEEDFPSRNAPTSPVFSSSAEHRDDECLENNQQIASDAFGRLVNNIFEESQLSVDVDFQIPIQTTSTSLKCILFELQLQVNLEKVTKFNIFRNDVFNCCLRALRRKDFNPFNNICVKFSDLEGISEGAVDGGGPKREMFRLVMNELMTSNLFTGNDKKHISLNNNALHKKHYFEAGRLIALSLIHGGPGPHFLSETLFCIISNGVENSNIQIEDLEEEIKTKLSLFEEEDDLSKLQELILLDTIFSTAGCQYIYSLDDKPTIVKDVLRFYGYQRVEEAIKQFIDGLKTGGIYDKICEHSLLFKPVMCGEKDTVNAEKFEKLFRIDYSDIGSNRREAENRAISYFRDYLLDCEDNSDDAVRVTDLLIFATGADTIPPLGFPFEAQIKFLHEHSSRYPMANTCGMELRIPTCHADYDTFKEHMDFAMLNSKTFGFA